MSNQLVKKNPAEGYQNVFPKTWIDAIKDKESGVSLQEILQGFNMYFLSYNGSRALTRCKVPSILRKEGLWITYVLYDHTVVTEWYNSDQIDDNSWSMDSNWRIASNNLVGDVSVSADGYWVINGEKTEAKAQGEQGVTPLLRVGANNKLQVSYNAGKTWKDISDYIVPKFRWNQGTDTSAGTIQISMDLGKTWTNLSSEITNNLRISRYIGINESLPTSGVAEGTIYMKGPYYNESDTSNTNPIYRMWVYAWKGNTLAWQDNGEFTVISAKVVQERGNSTTEVMSQDAITRELTKLEDEVSQVGQLINKKCNDLFNGTFPAVPITLKLQTDYFYRADLSYGEAVGYECAKVDIHKYNALQIYAALSGSAAIVLTNQNDNILLTKTQDNFDDGILEIDLTQYTDAYYLYFSNYYTEIAEPYIKGAINKYSIKENREDIDIEAEIDVTSEVEMHLGHFYRNSLEYGESTGWVAALIILDKENYTGANLMAYPRSGGYCSLTDSSDKILWQSNDASIFPVILNFEDYPTCAKLYISSSPEVTEQYTPRYPTIKYIYQRTLAQRFQAIEQEIEELQESIISDNTTSFKKEILSNTFVPANILEKPSGFGAFSIPINISRNSAGIYGWDINPSRMRIKNSNNATYYVATNGNDSNDGLTKNTPLKTIEQALSKSDINTIVLLNGTFTNGINFTAGCVVNKDVNILGIGSVIIKSINNQQPIKIKSAVYVENIIFDGGYYAIKTELTDELCVFNKCKFINSSGEYGNGFNALGGNYIMYECEASNNMRDGFNYHSNTVDSTVYYPEIIEINCYGFYNGIADTNYINNCSTAHEASKIIRIYCEYGMSKGVVVADADGAYSLNYSVVAYSTSNIDGTDNRKGNFGSQGANSKVWLYDCISHGSKYDIVTDSDCTIYTTDRYSNELNNGTIVDIQ